MAGQYHDHPQGKPTDTPQPRRPSIQDLARLIRVRRILASEAPTLAAIRHDLTRRFGRLEPLPAEVAECAASLDRVGDALLDAIEAMPELVRRSLSRDFRKGVAA